MTSLAGLAAASALPMPAWARGASMTEAGKGSGVLSGEDIHLSIGDAHFATGGRSGHAIAVNGTIPGPLIRLVEGQTARLHVTNNLAEDSSIHWHGLLLPFQFDGVPGVSFPGIRPGETFTYDFPIRQAGTYWWHSHSGLQEQMGHYGPIVIAPKDGSDERYTRDYVVLLSEFTPLHPHQIMRRLKVAEGYFNEDKLTLTEGEMSLSDRLMWGRMRMNPRDISDVGGATYTYLVNGHGPEDNLELAFRPGEKVRLRIINGSAMTFFNVRIPGVPMQVIQADGQDVRAPIVDELQIGVAETYDVVIEPGDGSHAFVAEAMDRSGMALASITSHAGHRATPPPLREVPTLTMADMGMGGMDHAAMGHGGMDHGAANQGSGGMDHSMRDTSKLPADVEAGPGLDMVASMPVDRMDFPGLGLDSVDHRVLRYTDLRSRRLNEKRAPDRRMEIHLTGNMERYMWSFDGKKFSAVTDDPIRFAFNERVRVTLVNDTMMAHPIHLHGHFFELVNGAEDGRQPKKHTLIVQPGSKATFDLTADEPGDWAFHCHLLYHMHAGMMQVVTVRPMAGDSA